MDYKKTSAESTTVTRNLKDLDVETGNIYKTVNILAKRGNQLNVKLKEELSSKLAEFASNTDNLEEIFENREQIEISRYYERLPKPSAVAIEEFEEGKVYYRFQDENKTEES